MPLGTNSTISLPSCALKANTAGQEARAAENMRGNILVSQPKVGKGWGSPKTQLPTNLSRSMTERARATHKSWIEKKTHRGFSADTCGHAALTTRHKHVGEASTVIYSGHDPRNTSSPSDRSFTSTTGTPLHSFSMPRLTSRSKHLADL